MQAFAPGSVTALFAPTASGTESIGVSFAIGDGIVADVDPADETRVAVDGEPTSFHPVELALDALGATAAVDLSPEIPIGRGFGASGAATLATALAANETFGLGASRNDLVGTAHEAEVEAGTGLGDVFIQSLGGLVLSNGSGMHRRESDATIEYVSRAGIDTSEVLGDAGLMERVTDVGGRLIYDLPLDPSLERVTADGWRFARDLGLATDWVQDVVDDVEAAGGVGSMAMVGETVFAVGVDGVLESHTTVSNEGAALR